MNTQEIKPRISAKGCQCPPCQAARQPTVLASGQRVTLSIVALRDTHPVLGKTHEALKSCRNSEASHCPSPFNFTYRTDLFLALQ